jgi:ferric-dicitrate binding protein FerR (iron transport regulator)
MITAGFLWLNTGKEKDQRIPVLAKDEKPILPGEAGAVLKLDDGRMIVLDSTRNGLVASNAAANVIVENGKITYQPLEGAAARGEDVYNTMVTMRGKVYRMVLPDGTKVWLNASTQFRYPVAFRGKERRVRLMGEAYFEVAEDPSKPFIVQVEHRGEVKVLGTQFNVNAYAEEPQFTTTLLEGKVQLSSIYKNAKGGDQQPIILKPEEQCILRENKDMILHRADLEQTMAWKNGMFVFKSAGLKDVFSQLGRWYDVHFVNEENIDAVYSGSMYRSADFYELLKLIEFTTNLSFRVEGRRVFVTSKK